MPETTTGTQPPPGDADNGSALEPGSAARAIEMPVQEVIITLVGEYFAGGQRIWSGGLVLLLAELGFSDTAARVALGRVVSRGLLTKVKEGRRVFYHATSRLEELLAEGHRQTFWFRYDSGEWDGSWTFVWYAIPERLMLARRRLSRRLAFLGFAALQDGTWIAPRDTGRDVQTIVAELDIDKYVLMLVGHSVSRDNEVISFERGWDLPELESRYARFREVHEPLLTRTAISGRDAFVARAEILEFLRQVAALDPKVLDDRLGPSLSDQRSAAIAIFDRLEDLLRAPATGFVTSISSPPE